MTDAPRSVPPMRPGMLDAGRRSSLEDLEHLLIRPGDTLVVAISQYVDADHLNRMRAQFRELLPDTKVVIVEASALAVVRDPLGTEAAEQAIEQRAMLLDPAEVDPDCRDGKHASCVGGDCVCPVRQAHSTPHKNDATSL